MAKIVSDAVYEPGKLPEVEMKQLAHDVYHQVVARIFGTLSEEAFEKALLSTSPAWVWLQVLKNEADLPVGFQFIRLFEYPFEGKTCGIFRALSGLLPEYRGQNKTTTFGLKKWVWYRTRHPRRRLFYAGPLVHPTSYSLFAKYAPEIWPNWREPTPPPIEQFLCEVADHFGLERVDPDRPLVRDAHTSTRETEKERAYWALTDRPAARFFVEQVPDYAAGYGLFALMPLNGRLIRHTLRLSAGQLVRRRVAMLEHGLQRRGLPIALLPRPNPVTLLKQTALFHHLDDEALTRLAPQAEVVTLEAGRYLFRQGDPGDSLYVIVRGTAEVVFEDGAESHTIDDLGYGEVVGEMALLTGEPRNASIRAATLLTLVRIGQAALHDVMQSGPEVRDAIWSAFAARRFDNYVRGLPRFQRLTPETRRDWIAGQPQVVLEPGAMFTPEPETAYLFLVTGEAEIDQGGAWVAMRAPALAECGTNLRLQSLSATRLIPLPARENEAS